MIDDEKLQELLGKASSLYNNGQYQGAIEAWQEALTVDPSNQKAKEGIRMATLLIGEWEPPAAGAAGREPAADTLEPDLSGLPPEEIEARLELGMARVKQLISERQFLEALEGAQGLLPLAPDSGELQRLLDEARQGFESAPFVDEHLTLARELLEQERYAEAEAECRKIFVMDAHHPGGRALMKEIKERVQQSLQRAASQMGGMTVKLSLPRIPRGPGAATGARAPDGPAGAEQRAAAAEPPAAVEPLAAGEPTGADDLFAAGEPFGAGEPIAAADAPAAEEPLAAPATAAAEGGAAPEPPIADLDAGDLAKEQEEVRSRDLLEQAFEQAGVEAQPAALPVSEAPGDGDSPFELSHGPGGTPEEVEAKTVVPPQVRTGSPQPATPAPAREPATAGAAPPSSAPARPSAPKSPAASKPPAAPKPPATPKPAAGPKPAPAGTGAAPDTGADPSAWESELAQLNLKEGERGILKGTGAKPGSIPVGESPDVDLMSLLDGDFGSGSGGPEPATPAAAPPAPAARPRPVARPETRRADPAAESTVVREAPSMRARGAERARSTPVHAPLPRSSVPKLFAVSGLLIVAGAGAAWHFYFQPRLAAGQPLFPALLGSPPQGAPAGPNVAPGPIPTPIGGPSRPQPQEGQPAAGEPAGVAAVTAAPELAATEPAAPAESPGPPGGGARPEVENPAAAPAGTPAADVPIKPREAPRLSPEETRRRIASYTADGRRLLALGKWREARAKFLAVLALDAANLDVKEMADEAQAKIDDEQRLMNDMDSARQLVKDKDYENALRKLYRMPRDRGLGDIDLYIRNAWFNWAVVLLKAGNSKDAINKLNEVLVLDPDDAEALRLQEVAERYTAKAKDRVYYAFTDTLKLRAFDQR